MSNTCMTIAALAGERGAGWHVQDMQRAAARLGYHLHCCGWRSLRGPVSTADGVRIIASDIALHAVDAVLVRTMPPGTLEQIVFRMDALAQLHGSGVRVVNPPRGVEICVDKYLACARIARAGLPTPPTQACQTAANAMIAFDELGGDVVVKPLFGSEGFGIQRVSDRDLAARVFTTLERMGSVIYLQQYIEHGHEDFRLLVLGDTVLTSMRRVARDWRCNVARGGTGEAWSPGAAIINLAVKAAQSCETLVAGVDVVFDKSGAPYVLEVNAVPGWRALTGATGVDIATEVLSFVAAGSRDGQVSR